MFLATLVMTCCAFQAPGPAGPSGPARAAPPPTGWQRVETLRMLLEQKLRDQAPAIGPKPLTLDRYGRGAQPGAAKEDPAPEQETGANDRLPKMADRFNDGVWQNLLQAQSNFAVRGHGEFVPGLGAVLSFTVPVRCDFVPPTDEKTTDKKAPKKSDDDAEWDAVASGRQRTPTEDQWRAAAMETLDARLPKGSFVLSPDALAALKKCALDTAWRFGAKLELARGERLAIVVVAEPTPGAEQRFSGWYPQGGSYPTAGDGSVELPLLYWSFGRGMAPELPPVKRLVVVVTSEELKSYRAGDVDSGELDSIASGDF